jgi:hypothetical protein
LLPKYDRSPEPGEFDDRLEIGTAQAARCLGQNVRVSEVSEAAGTLTSALIVDGAVAADPVISPDGRWVAWTTSSARRGTSTGRSRSSAPSTSR